MATNVVEKQRSAQLAEMAEPLRPIAMGLSENLRKGSAGVVLVHYNLGVAIRPVADDKTGIYGESGMSQLAKFLNIPGGTTTLYALRQFADAFDDKFVHKWSVQPMADGGFLTLSHWLAITKIEGRKAQLAALERVFAESLSANDLEREVQSGGQQANSRQGGRKPLIPSSTLAAVRKTFTLANAFSNYAKAASKVFDRVDSMDAAKVDKALLDNLVAAEKAAETAEGQCRDLIVRLQNNVTRVTEVLDKKYEKSEEAYEEQNGKPAKSGKKTPVVSKKLKKKKGKKAAAAAATA